MKQVMRKILMTSLKNLKRHLTGGEKIILPSSKILIVSFGILVSSFLIINKTYADENLNLNYSVTVEPALNITTSSNKVSLDLNPLNHDFDSQDLTVSVSTNNETGYKLYVNTENKTTQLIEKDDDSLYIDTLSSEVPENSFTANRWGYKLNSGNYLPFVPGTLINSSKTQIENNSSTLTFAAKVGYETKAGTYALALNFQATANPHIYEIQNLDSNLCTEDPMTVIDNRDGQEYVIQRLKDNNCWMMTNLKLGAIALTEDLTSSNTHLTSTITAATFNSWKIDTPQSVYTAGKYYIVSGTDPVSDAPYGILYNYCATSANTVCDSSTTKNATYDLCPAGWRLATGGSSGEFYNLYNQSAYKSYDKARASVADGGLAFTLTGEFGNLEHKSGRFWASNAVSGTHQYSFTLHNINDTQTVQPGNDTNKFSGCNIRCIRAD